MAGTDDFPQTVFNIYAGRSLEDLDKRSENFPSQRIRKLTILKKCKCGGKLMKEAIISYELGDLEMAYIKYKRYLMLFEMIHNSSDYLTNENAVTQMLGSNDYQIENIKRLEILMNSLKVKYDELAAEEKRLNKTIELVNPHKSAIPVKKIPLCRRLQAKKREYITCQELHKLINVKSAVALEVILDCRPCSDDFESKIIHQCFINIDKEIIQRGVTIGQIESGSKPDSIVDTIWKYRNAAILKGVLYTWDIKTNYKLLKFLKGGFAEFLKLYPQLTMNPYVVPAPSCKALPAKTTVDTFKYSSTAEITMKEESFSIERKNISVINEDSTPESVKKFNVKSLKDKVVASEKLADKSALLGQELLNAEQEVKNAIMATESVSDTDNQQKENQKVNELEYDVLQLENTSHDIVEEFHMLYDEISEEKEFLPDAIAKDKLKNIKEKESEIQKLTEISEQVSHEKRLYETREVIYPSPIKRPPTDQLDKSVSLLTEVLRELTITKLKPAEIIPRDLTGLENLSITSYVNPMLQCLSNTNSLTEYFINRIYARHLESGKYHIVESLGVLIRGLWCSKFDAIAPRDFFTAITERYTPFRDDRMEDLQELLMLLIAAYLAKPKSRPLYPPIPI